MERLRRLRSLWRKASSIGSGKKWVSAGGVVVGRRRGSIAIVKQRARRGHLRWTFPKGRVDPGESIQEAALREVYEESGLRARIVCHLGVYESPRNVIHYFLMDLVRIEGEHDDETIELRFATARDARKLLRSRRDRSVLQRALDALLGLDAAGRS